MRCITLAAVCFTVSALAWSDLGASQIAAENRLQLLLDSLDGIRKKNNIAALGLALVASDKVIWNGSLGVMSHKSRKATDDETLYRIGSITKSFTSLAALKLQERGLLQLSEPINKWSTQRFYQNRWQSNHPLQIDQLLEHTAGLQDMVQAEWDYSKPQAESLQQTLLLYPDARQVQWQPGMHSSYSNAGAALAGFVLEQTSGKSYEEIIDATLFKPLAMHNSSVLPPKNIQRLATGYDTDGTTAIPYWHIIFRPAAAISSTTTDMANFVQMLINKGRFRGRTVFNPQSIERMENPSTTLAARHQLSFGYGLGNYQWLRDGILFHGHGGDADGYLSRYGYSHSNNSGYFLVINAFQGRSLNAMRGLIERYLTQGVEVPMAPAPAVLSNQQKAKVLGHYQAITTRFRRTESDKLTVTEHTGLLFSQLNQDDKAQLIPVNAKLYRRKNENMATIAIVDGDDGKTYFQGDMGNFVKTLEVNAKH
ncbi:MAG: serine hydrolase domain-containing protein [Pseudomonadales bacterium]